jgi:hypothetical protein
MSTLSSVAAYAGRTVDLLAFRPTPANATPEQLLQSQTLVGPTDGGLLIAGLGKLAQRVMMTLLTPLGSQLYSPALGTQFITDMLSGAWRTPADVMQSFYSARLDVAQQLQTTEFINDPLDEQYSGMTLMNVTFGSDTITLQIALTSQAGSTTVFLAPIAVPIT